MARGLKRVPLCDDFSFDLTVFVLFGWFNVPVNSYGPPYRILLPGNKMRRGNTIGAFSVSSIFVFNYFTFLSLKMRLIFTNSADPSK